MVCCSFYCIHEYITIQYFTISDKDHFTCHLYPVQHQPLQCPEVILISSYLHATRGSVLAPCAQYNVAEVTKGLLRLGRKRYFNFYFGLLSVFYIFTDFFYLLLSTEELKSQTIMVNVSISLFISVNFCSLKLCYQMHAHLKLLFSW